MRSSPAPGTWTSFSRFAAADISRVKTSVTSTSTSVKRGTMPTSSPRITLHGVRTRTRTAGSRVAENVPANATCSMGIARPLVRHRNRRQQDAPFFADEAAPGGHRGRGQAAIDVPAGPHVAAEGDVGAEAEVSHAVDRFLFHHFPG